MTVPYNSSTETYHDTELYQEISERSGDGKNLSYRFSEMLQLHRKSQRPEKS